MIVVVTVGQIQLTTLAQHELLTELQTGGLETGKYNEKERMVYFTC